MIGNLEKSFQKLLKRLSSAFKATNKELIKRKRILNTEDIFYQEILSAARDVGKRATSSISAILTEKVTTPQAIYKFSNKLDLSHLQRFSRIIDSYFPRKNRVIAVDGTRLALSRNIDNPDKLFKATPSGSYHMSLLTTLYDTTNYTPISFSLMPYGDERAGFMKLVDCLKPGDTVIFDRGYFSEKLLEILQRLKIKWIFRLKANSKMVSNNQGEDVKINYLKHRFRKIEQTIKGQKYYFITNLSNRNNCQKISDLYHSRWSIEEWYKLLKVDIGGRFYPFKTVERVNKKIYWQVMTAQLLAISSNQSQARITKKGNYCIGLKYLLANSADLFSHFAFIDKSTFRNLTHLFRMYSITCLSYVIKFRSYPRKSIIDRGIWYRGKGLSC